MRRHSAAARRALRTVLFTDIVGSTELAAKLGDRRWRDLLRRHHALMRRALRRHGGREVDTAGDGFFAVFDGPEAGIHCALEMADAVAALGITLRAGLHIGETETIDGKVGGVAVHIAARIMARASAGEVLVSGTVRELVTGSDIEFDDLGQHELKGVPGSWRIMRVIAPSVVGGEIGLARDAADRTMRRTRTAVLAAAAVVLAAAGLAALAAQLSGDARPSTAAGPDTIVRIDGASSAIAQAVRVGSGPVALAAGDGVLWVANLDDQTLSRVDLTRGEEQARTGGVGVPTSLAVAGEGVWVADLQGAVYYVDARTNRATRVLSDIAGGSAVAAGEGWLWVLDGTRDRVVRIDPATRQLSMTIDLPSGSGAVAIAVGEGAVWVANGLTDSVARIDPQSGEVVVPRIALCCRPSAVSVSGGYVWVSSAESDRVQRIAPVSDSVSLTLDVGDGPVGVAADEAAVWVPNALDGTIWRLDHGGRVVARIDVPGQATAALVVDGALWVALARPDR